MGAAETIYHMEMLVLIGRLSTTEMTKKAAVLGRYIMTTGRAMGCTEGRGQPVA